MSLSARLAALQSQTGIQSAPRPAARSVAQTCSEPALRRLKQRESNRHSQAEKSLFRHLAAGDDILDLKQSMGIIELERAIPVDRAGLGANVPEWLEGPLWSKRTRLDSMVFFDTETTGLAGGTGTLVFQVGLAWFAEETLRVYQSILTRPAHESDFMQRLQARLGMDTTLVSYNGKSFDAPLLTTRCLMNRLQDKWAHLPHVDLLHAVRRAFRDRWVNCSLKVAESTLLGVNRVDDLPGALAPAAWQSFLREARISGLMDVLRHNEQDVVSLAGLAVRLSEVYADPLANRAHTARVAGSWLEINADLAEAFLVKAPPDDHASKRLLADIRRRSLGYESAIDIWRQLSDQDCTESLRRLAIYYEHHARDLPEAFSYARRLYLAEATADNQRRLNRLAMRLAPAS